MHGRGDLGVDDNGLLYTIKYLCTMYNCQEGNRREYGLSLYIPLQDIIMKPA